MPNNIILDALKTQLTDKQNKRKEYKETVYDRDVELLTGAILVWLQENVSSKIARIAASERGIEIMRSENQKGSWAATTLYFDKNWKDNAYQLKMNWYGSSANSKDVHSLFDVEIMGAIASKFNSIEAQSFTEWLPAFSNINKPFEKMEEEIYEIERSIRQVESDIKAQDIDRYKKPGFQLTLNPRLDYHRNWNDDDSEYELKEHPYLIKLSLGRSNYEYIWVNSFKVIKANNYKVTLEIPLMDREDKAIVTHEVTVKKFDSFVKDAYEWQNGGSEKHNEAVKERFERYYAKKETTTA